MNLELEIEFSSKELPGLYQSADKASLDSQNQYLFGIKAYTFFLIVAAIVAFFANNSADTAIVSAFLFLVSIGITIWLNVIKPENIWYNGMAVAESVKTRSWRWMMRAEPYDGPEKVEVVSREFITDLKKMLEQNRSLGDTIGVESSAADAISPKMLSVRSLHFEERAKFYKKFRVDEQALWYWKKTKFNKRMATFWFWIMIALHALAILFLLYKIKAPGTRLPIEILALCASSVLSWLQTKKHKELSSSYSLTAQEISLIRGEFSYVDSDESLSKFVIDSENAFSREHTQWYARKKE